MSKTIVHLHLYIQLTLRLSTKNNLLIQKEHKLHNSSQNRNYCCTKNIYEDCDKPNSLPA